MISVSPIPAFKDNYHWLIRGNNETWVVDPGDGQKVAETLAESGETLSGILVTHHHWDHVDGIGQLITEGLTIAGPSKEKHKLVNRPLSLGDKISVCGVEFDVLEVPGHTLNHLAYFCQPDFQAPLLFCGDTLFAGGCGRLFEGTPAQMQQSLSQLAQLPKETQVYCAHEYTLANLEFALTLEPDNLALLKRIENAKIQRQNNLPTIPSTIELELRTNPFLRSDSESIKSSLRKSNPKLGDSKLDVFTATRRMKDKY